MKLSVDPNTGLELMTFFEMTPDLVCIAGKDGYFKKINSAVTKILGYTEKELFAKPIFSFIHPEDREFTSRSRNKLLNGKALVNFENRYLTKKGKIVWLAWTSVYLPDKELVFALAKDISKRKKAESEITEKYNKFKSLARHFKSSIEKERKYLATELHEELAQLTSVLKMDIDWISSNAENLEEIAQKKIDHASAISDLLISTIRRISFSLSPSMLHDIGLIASLKWHCNEFSILNGIPCTFEGSCNESKLSNEVKLDVFRICQEALSNVMYHARAKNVKIHLAEKKNKLILIIQDDGIGFDVEKHKKSDGIIIMRERAASIHSQLIVSSKKNKGTKISVEINL